MLPLIQLAVLLIPTLAHPVDERWFQPIDSTVNSLFVKRAPDPNSGDFASNYPALGTPPPSSLPSAWTQKLASITLPNVGVSNPNNGYPTYTNNEPGQDSTICSFTYECTTSDDLYNPPANTFALSFDDGPTSSSPQLNTFLAQNNISNKATHFMIGGNILGAPTQMQDAFTAGGHIAVHTWSHPYMTTLSNEGVLGELGWTMQIISDLTGGRVPKYWRPPFGDVDNRVRTIAKQVFGLETVVWNQDTGDWAIGNDPSYTIPSVESTMSGWLTSSNKSTGLLVLEHELNDNTVGVFMAEYPVMQQNGWKVMTVADAFGMSWYQNSEGDTGTVISQAIAGNSTLSITSSISTSTSSSITSTSSSSSLSSTGSPSLTSTSTSSISSTGKLGVSGIIMMLSILVGIRVGA
ncbi:hypothetical protein TREMEDRAFT_70983 [Tremella mesenterica DSM 1558]|uniref:uncharacterized protein n=1 Tax=Tremella mesenterica (strain ATCC 24925 / CBS 8224 / DSM 1558 / NBRC 9311 / NRRL Y-6157 / RJB 2259-6 / UBC 559-6) TaxID=578456 RepID=UPI0003F49D8B|nr:uncharacterized protein TREMEDRAFT_70983 [Tremella mesenterica DSM 1558]EIW73508.1 hypothetical protein TREMEDRAFT_70983 [Tremella mesenterica DSM 1558]